MPYRPSPLTLLIAATVLGSAVAEAATDKKPAAAAPTEKRAIIAKRPPPLPSDVFAPLLTVLPKADGGETLVGPTLGARPGAADDPTADPVYAAFQRGLWVEAFALALPRAEAGDTDAMTMLGTLYETGLGTKIDQEKAAKWYGLASERGDREAAAALAQKIGRASCRERVS
jgi:TPR repeat protein